MKNLKKTLLVLASTSAMLAFGCGDGLWASIHNFAIHGSEITQFLGALDQLEIVNI